VITVSRDTKFVHLAWQRMRSCSRRSTSHGLGPDRSHLPPFRRARRGFGPLAPGDVPDQPPGDDHDSEVNFYNLGRNVEEILRKIIANKHLAANPARPARRSGRRSATSR